MGVHHVAVMKGATEVIDALGVRERDIGCTIYVHPADEQKVRVRHRAELGWRHRFYAVYY